MHTTSRIASMAAATVQSATKRATRSIAYLGPAGTYGEQAASRFNIRLGGDLNLVPVPTIPSIYTHPADFLVLPLENTLHGAVLDTVDSLLTPLTPGTKTHPRAVADTALRIEHQLVARRGTTLAQVEFVRSHEQALGQSKAFLDEFLPHAKRVSWPSTAGAVQSILEDEDGAKGAAICSKAAYEQNRDKLDLLHAGTQGVKDNFTRFLLLTRLSGDELPEVALVPGTATGTVVSFFACDEPAQVGGLAADGIILSVHQRPAPPGTTDENGEPTPFPRWTLVETEDQRPDPDEKDRCGATCLGVFPTEKIMGPVAALPESDFGIDGPLYDFV